MAVFWVDVPCSLAEDYRRFRGRCCLHHQDYHHLQSKYVEETQEETSESEEEEEGQREGEITKLSEYQVLEQTYHNVLAQMDEKEGVETFAQEYIQIFKAFYKAHAHEEELMKENETLQAQAETNTAKTAVAERLAAASKETIDQLKCEIQQAWKMVDSAHAREENSLEVIENLRLQISQLITEMEQRVQLGLDQSEESGSAMKDRDNFLKERECLMDEIVILKEQLSGALNVQEDLERKNSAADLRCSELTQELENQRNEINKELHIKKHLEEELKVLLKSLDEKSTQVTSLKHQLGQAQHDVGKLETNVKDLKALNERLQRNFESLSNRLAKMQVDFELQAESLEKLKNENSTKTHELKMQGEEVTRLHSEVSKVGNMHEQCVKKLTHSENQRGSLEQEKEKLKGVIGQLEKDLGTAKKQMENNRKTCDDLQKDREILNKNIQKAARGTFEQQKLLKEQEEIRRGLEKEIDNLNLETNKQRKMIDSLEKERDRYIFQSQELNQKLQDTLDKVKLNEKAIFDHKKKISEADTKFKIQENLFEAVQNDRNTFRKMLLEAQDEISELTQKLKVMSYLTEQLKEDITTKERQLMKEEHALQKSEKERENQKIEVRKLKDELHDSKEQITALNLEERKLHKLIQDTDEERKKQKKVMDQIIHEQHILGTELVKRNHELSLLYEKINILQNTLHKGEVHYDQRLEDIRLLKLEIKRLREEKNLLSKRVTSMTDMRQEIFHLERELTREKLKCHALEEELQSPLNIHHWRKLEGSDPSTYKLIQKSQLLQKRLLVQTQTAIKQEAQLQESEHLYLNLCEVLACQSGPRVAIRLQETQHILKDRERKMKLT
ncbi:cilia- and flagella-associated protein 58-like isoform X3 [Zootermopsis nevadensis]|uniref:cilia- and flagella-associated protein 58-like isoform X3 n=1 Tax=Zootermopsis nevadensis TaxID=136037 RepID=UPI000B8EC7CF|nr:cilia- and flagella-associated protein 58-like isoform X3 [Zootermopsis nevadensis]